MQADLDGNSNGIPKKLANVWPFVILPATSLKQLSDNIRPLLVSVSRTMYMTKACRTVTSNDFNRSAFARALSTPVRYLEILAELLISLNHIHTYSALRACLHQAQPDNLPLSLLPQQHSKWRISNTPWVLQGSLETVCYSISVSGPLVHVEF